MNKVISVLSRLAICHKATWKESLLPFNYQHLEKQIATLEENSLQRVSSIKFSHFNNKFHKGTTENQLGHEEHLWLLWGFKRHQLLEVNSSTTHYIMQIHRLCTHFPLHFITPFLQGKTDALVRLKLKLRTKIQKTGLSCLLSNACRVLPVTEDNSQPTRHKHSPALLKGPEPCGLSHLSAPPYFTKYQQQTFLLPALLLQRAPL